PVAVMLASVDAVPVSEPTSATEATVTTPSVDALPATPETRPTAIAVHDESVAADSAPVATATPTTETLASVAALPLPVAGRVVLWVWNRRSSTIGPAPAPN